MQTRSTTKVGKMAPPVATVTHHKFTTVTIYREPSPAGYAQEMVATGDDELSPLAFPDLSLTAARILG